MNTQVLTSSRLYLSNSEAINVIYLKGEKMWGNDKHLVVEMSIIPLLLHAVWGVKYPS